MKFLNFKKGEISGVFTGLIVIAMLSMIFFHFIFVQLDLVKYDQITRYGRDLLLVLETSTTIDSTYLKQSKSELSKKLVKSNQESVTIRITVGNKTYDVDTLAGNLIPSYGDTLKLEIIYYNKPTRINFTKGLIGSKDDIALEPMGIVLSTVSKSRGTTDG